MPSAVDSLAGHQASHGRVVLLRARVVDDWQRDQAAKKMAMTIASLYNANNKSP